MPASPDLFGILDVVKLLTAPVGLQDAHVDGFSWAKAGLSYPDTTKLTAEEWNRIIGNLRRLAIGSGLDISTLDPASPDLLRTVVSAYIASAITGSFQGLFEANVEEIAAELAAVSGFIDAIAEALPDGVLLGAANLSDLTDVEAARDNLDVYSKGEADDAVQTLTNKTLTEPIITLQQGSNVSPTDEGHIEWDHNNNAIVVGTGGATKVFAGLPAGVAAGDLLYVSGTRTLARLPKGSARQFLKMNFGVSAPEWVTGVSHFVSAEQTITVAGALTIAHGRGAAPDFVFPFLICKTTQYGYAVGDIVPVNLALNSSASGANGGQALTWDATNIYVRFNDTAAGTYVVVRKDTGSAVAQITNANWRLILKAF